MFRITPYPYHSNFDHDFLIVCDNEDKIDSNSNVGIISLPGVKFSNYVIQELYPNYSSTNNSSNKFIIHQAEISIHERLPDPVINFVESDFDNISIPEEDKFPIIPNQYVIILRQNIKQDPQSVADEFAEKGANILYIYDTTLKGFAINVQDQTILQQIQNDSRVSFVEQDKMGHIASIDTNMNNKLETVPTGVDRIDADLNSNVVFSNNINIENSMANHNLINSNIIETKQKNQLVIDNEIDQEDEQEVIEAREEKNNTNIDIAILDTGISLVHPDLNVYKDITFVAGPKTGNDDQGHGSHIAGIIAAKDNSLGIIGIDPNARLWSVKVCDKLGNCPLSSQINGIEYITEQADEIDIANISFENSFSPVLDRVINQSVAAGVTYIVAAGNSGKDASYNSPASNPSVLTVSAIGDSDGKCGGLGRPTFIGADDKLASFSNFGPVVDIAAPGVDILTTYNGTEYAVKSGTSTAAPHVTGVAALYKTIHPTASPHEVYQALVTLASFPNTECDGNGHGYFQGDNDGFSEPLLYVSKDY